MTKADLAHDRALEKIQTLYVMQTELIHALTGDLSDPRARKHARHQMREFEVLLGQADHRYMGGEDVLESLKSLPIEMSQKLKTSRVIVKRRKGSPKKATAKNRR